MGGYTKGPIKMASEIYSQQNKMIHRALTQLGMPYEENKGFWLPLFQDVIGRKTAESISGMNLGERYEVIAHLQHRGVDLFNPRIPLKIKAWRKGYPDVPSSTVVRPMRVAPSKWLFVKKIHAILADMKLPWGYVDGIARKRFGVEFVEWCDEEGLFKIVQMLSVHQKRHAGDRAEDGKSRSDEETTMEVKAAKGE